MAQTGPSRYAVVRDSILLAGGILGIGYQQITGQVNALLIGVYLTMLGVPTVVNGAWLLKQIGERPSSRSPDSASSTESSKPSPRSEV